MAPLPGARERELRRQLAEVIGELSDIPADRFDERAALLGRRHELSAELHALVSADHDRTLSEWATRAGSKQAVDEGQPFIPSRFESGSM